MPKRNGDNRERIYAEIQNKRYDENEKVLSSLEMNYQMSKFSNYNSGNRSISIAKELYMRKSSWRNPNWEGGRK